MIRCQTCGTENLDGSQYCDECGSKLSTVSGSSTDVGGRPKTAESPAFRGASVTSVGVPAVVDEVHTGDTGSGENGNSGPRGRASLMIERGESTGTEFSITGDEANIGRWDADNGIFPDIDLDSHDQEAKVSRRHARIIRRDGKYFIEDLGSTNGTYVNRGRRLLPGQAQSLSDGDEIIVGKTFLRFHINN